MAAQERETAVGMNHLKSKESRRHQQPELVGLAPSIAEGRNHIVPVSPASLVRSSDLLPVCTGTETCPRVADGSPQLCGHTDEARYEMCWAWGGGGNVIGQCTIP